MAYDAEPGRQPQDAYCPGCQRAILNGSPTTKMHFDKDPYGLLGLSGELWHAECARPFWDNSAETLRNWGLADRF
jgi:hypothetical protein